MYTEDIYNFSVCNHVLLVPGRTNEHLMTLQENEHVIFR